jgi:flagellar protein FliJ
MSRVTRMQPVQTIVDKAEQQRAEALSDSEKKLKECESKLNDLMKYDADYKDNYQKRVSGGMSSLELRDYQMFLIRLGEAIKQQALTVNSARAERDAHRKRWQEAAVKAKAVEHVIDKWQVEERQQADQRDQRDSDERAQRSKSNKSFVS